MAVYSDLIDYLNWDRFIKHNALLVCISADYNWYISN